MSDGMGREPAYLSSHATNRYFIPNWGNIYLKKVFLAGLLTSTQNLFSIKIRANTSHEVSALIYLV